MQTKKISLLQELKEAFTFGKKREGEAALKISNKRKLLPSLSEKSSSERKEEQDIYEYCINRRPGEKPIISVRNLKKIFFMGEEKVRALNNVSLDIYKGEFVCLLGQSGSGKSTFLNMLAGLEKPTRGTIFFSQVPVHSLSEVQITDFRQQNIGFIFQAYNLLPTLTAVENAALPLAFKGMGKKQRNEKAIYYLEKVGLAKMLGRKPGQMSGGQQQRVGIARALTVEPKIIFADEPTGNLDTQTTKEVLQLIRTCIAESKQTLILVTHDPKIADYADLVVTLQDGDIVRIKEKGKIIAEKANIEN